MIICVLSSQKVHVNLVEVQGRWLSLTPSTNPPQSTGKALSVRRFENRTETQPPAIWMVHRYTRLLRPRYYETPLDKTHKSTEGLAVSYTQSPTK